MHLTTKKTLFAMIATSFTFGCASQDSPEQANIVDVASAITTAPKSDDFHQTIKDAQDYYKVRKDFRKCAAPACGGWFLSSLNQPTMQCPDGSTKQECYVPEVSLSVGIHLDSGDIVHGWFGTKDIFGNDILEADFAYESVLDDSWSYGSHSVVFNNGLVCIQSPCPSTSLRYMNTNLLWSDANYFYWADTPEEDEKLEEAFRMEYANDLGEPGGGAITFGDFWYWGTGYHYSVYNVFTEKKAQSPACVIYDDTRRTTAWSFSTRSEAEVFAAGYDQNISVLDGYCGDQEFVCAAIYEPVHGGIDTNNFDCEVYSNACNARAAIISAAGTSKATGTWYLGGTCEEEE